MKRRSVVFAAAAVAASAGAVALKPRRRASRDYTPISLEAQVPSRFGAWSIDKTLVPVLPDPSLQAALGQIYGQVLARTYINRDAQRVMLSIAYGEDQGTDATAAHRPEFCYAAQGFSVMSMGQAVLGLGGRDLTVRRLVGQLQARREPITYWVTLNDRAVLPGFSRKMEQIRLGLMGQIPDGMLVRVSSIAADPMGAFHVQERFLNDLLTALPPELQSRYFGSLAG